MLRNYINICRHTLLKCAADSQVGAAPKNLSSSGRAAVETILCPPLAIYQLVRGKSNKPKKQISDSDSDAKGSRESNDDLLLDRNTKVVTLSVTSLRVDGILKGALGIARHKIETLFYESKIRVNGQKISKKSFTVHVGDELDLIKGPDMKNPNFMNVARVEILDVKPNEDSISVKVRRCKSLSVDTYE